VLKNMFEHISASNFENSTNTITSTEHNLGQMQQHIDFIIERNLGQVHRHIDFTYRDMMVLLRNIDVGSTKRYEVITDYPIAYESLDHIFPHGAIQDNTRYPRFIKKCEMLFPEKNELCFLDLGCSGGGMVLDALLRRHSALGLEGCDLSLLQQRAEWRLIPENLKTCDITKPFSVLEKDIDATAQFDVISAWEVLEHIKENELPVMLANIKSHLADDGVFIASIANWDDIDPKTGTNWHVTTKEYSWWKDLFKREGFDICTGLFESLDLARGSYNPPNCFEEPYDIEDVDLSVNFHIAAKKTNNRT